MTIAYQRSAAGVRETAAANVPENQKQGAQLRLQLSGNEPDPRPFRPVQYLGSKLKLIPEILRAVDSVGSRRSGANCDLFSGSGVVTHALGARGTVVAVDIQEYGRVLASGILGGAAARPQVVNEVIRMAQSGNLYLALTDALAPLIRIEAMCMAKARKGEPASLDEFIEHSSLQRFSTDKVAIPRWLTPALADTIGRLANLPAELRSRSQITRLYGGTYFSFEQAIALDTLRDVISREAGSAERDLYMGALLSTASAAVNTVGKQFAQPIRLRKKDGSFRTILVTHTLADRALDILATYEEWGARWIRAASDTVANKHHVVRDDYSAFLKTWKSPIRAVYADPPYTIDHYSRFYHVLETVCLYDDPALVTIRRSGVPRLMRGLYRAERHQSPFCIPSTVEHAFADLFAGVASVNAPLVLSYSPNRSDGVQRPRLLNLATVTRMAKRRFSRVEIVLVDDHAHRKLNADTNNLARLGSSEVLLLCTH